MISNNFIYINKTGTFNYCAKHVRKEEESIALFESIIKTDKLKFAFIDYKNKELFFTANTVFLLDEYLITLKKKMNDSQTLLMIKSIQKQISFLEKQKYLFYGLNLKDIIVIDNYFFLINNEFMEPLINDNIHFNYPFTKPYFSSPEIINLTKLPEFISLKCFYYSFGAIIIYCLTNVYIFKANEIKTDNEIENILKPLLFSKLYWFLKRCLNSEIKERILLYI